MSANAAAATDAPEPTEAQDHHRGPPSSVEPNAVATANVAITILDDDEHDVVPPEVAPHNVYSGNHHQHPLSMLANTYTNRSERRL